MNKMQLIAAACCAVAATTTSTVHAQAKEMPGGLWEIKTKMEIPGMPAEMAAKMGGVQTMTHCIKPGERNWSDQQRGDRGERDRKCEQVQTKTDGNKISWTMKCADGMSGEGTVSHNGKDAYTMAMTMNMPQGSMKMHSEGKRLSETCEKAQK